MSDIQKKTVSIYIDQAASETALEKLQVKADGFNKKIDEARQKQTALRQEIEKLEPAAKTVDGLRKDYDTLAKSVSATTKNLAENSNQQRALKEQAGGLSDKLEAAAAKQSVLAAEIKKNEDAGKSVVALQRSYAVVEKEIELTTEKLNANNAAMQVAREQALGLSTALNGDKQSLNALSQGLKSAGAAAVSIGKLEKEIKGLDNTLDNYGKGLNSVEQQQRNISYQMDRGIGPSLVQQKALVEKLRREWEHLPQGTEEYINKTKDLSKAKENLAEMENALNKVGKAQKNWMDEFKGVAFGVAVGGIVQNVLQSVPSWISGIVSGNAKLSDSLADVSKATGLSDTAVASLNSSLSKLDTRTPTEQLRQIAIGLGQINEAATPENVSAIDKIVVALGDEFGGDANQITNVLSVLRNNLSDIKTGNYGEDVAHIGNALNVLGAEGLATAPVVTDIANRMAGVAETFGLTSGQILGTAATFQELGIETERGSTAFIKIMQKMSAEPEKFAGIAKAAGVATKEDFIDLLNKDMLGAFVKVAEGARAAGKDNVTFGKILKDLDADGSGAGEVLSKLSKNEELLSSKVKLASDALTNQNSITAEFNKKNTTFGAELDKLSKRLGSFITNSTLTAVFTGLIKGLNAVVTPTKTATQEFDELSTKVNHLDKDIIPLADRYDTLKSKTTLSAAEQTEMKSIISQITAVIPGAVTQFDDYGNAIAISTSRVRDFIDIEKARLQVVNKTAIDDNQEKLIETARKIEEVGKNIKDIEKSGTFDVSETTVIGGGVGVSSIKRKATQDEIANEQDKYRQLLQAYKGYFGEINKLNGQALQNQVDANKAAADETKKQTNIDLSPDADKKADGLLQKLKDFQFELQQVGKQADESEVARITKKYQELTSQAAAYGVHVIGLEKDKNAAIAFLIDEETKKRTEASKKAFTESAGKEYDQAIADSAAYFEGLKKQQAESFVAGAIDKKQYEANIAAIDVASKQQQLHTAEDYSAAVEKAAADVTKFKKEELAKEVADLIAANEKKLANEHLLIELANKAEEARSKNRIATSTPGSKERFDAIKADLDRQKNLELQQVQESEDQYVKAGIDATNDLNTIRTEINGRYRQQEAQAEVEYYAAIVNQYLSFASSALDIVSQFNSARSAREKADLDKELKGNDLKKAALQRQLSQKVISEQAYRIAIAKLDADAEAKKEALDKKQFERSKKIQIAQALVNGAMAITSTLAARPGAADIIGLGAARAIQIAIAVATTAAQIATISSAKYAGGGRVDHPGNGKINVASNIPVQPNGDDVLATVKRGEVIMNEDQQRRAGGPEFFRRLGVPGFAMGGIAKPAYQTRSYQAIDFAGATRSLQTVKHYATGGLVTQSKSEAPAATDPALLALLQSNQEALENLHYTVAGLQDRLSKPIEATANISLKKIDDAYAQKDRILEQATFK